MFLVPIEVESHSGHRAEERPKAFRWLGRRIEVSEIADRWYQGGVDPTQPVEDYFKVVGSDGKSYLLKFSRARDEWYLCVRIE
jgi:hypothetical protein